MYDSQRVTREAQQLASRYEICRLSEIGKSWCGRSISMLQIGKGSRPVLYAGAFHGMEWITAPLLLHFCRRLCQAWESGLTVYRLPIRPLLEEITLFCIPMVNPDGVEICLHGPASAGEYAAAIKKSGQQARWQANARGVDINHNFDAGWKKLRQLEIESGITGPGPTRYGGDFPGSERETTALISLCRQVPFSLVMAFHSQGEEIYWQYGEHTPAISHTLANTFSMVSGYRVAHPDPIASMGGFKDWFIETFHHPGFTIEVGKGRNPLPFGQLPAIESKVFPIMACGLTDWKKHQIGGSL